ncbi:uncharacterized protein LOC133844665 [Drosophila sulfurigaster albostrigata]|uniref:uncharacterized protein LOC133844665 n=1 Tax=Drosophila sulfurigaster albostrigata TaxID=89887 RepID=UPI002D21D8AE|nr:uncharacterized protein LOC133844665 [Drosophila sulfurigaster albostrigata]
MWILFILLLFCGGGLSYRTTRFTNLKCSAVDPSYVAFEKCQLKILGRGVVGLNIRMKLLKPPLSNGKVNLSLLRKFSGFRPFMFNVTFDFCNFLAKSTTELSFTKIVMDALATKSNINHSCPFVNDIVVDNFVLSEEFLKFLPLPTGEYQIQFSGATDNKWIDKVTINVLLD